MTGATNLPGSRVALVIIYNHKYEKNIDVLEAIYRDRFKHIYHLVPFYSGTRDNVIPVYESSFYFQGYVAQGYNQFKDPSFEHYFFVADDMILNPVITESTYASIFGLDREMGFIPELDSMPAPGWPHNRAALTFNPFRVGTEVRNELPSVTEAAEMMERYSVVNGPFRFVDTYMGAGRFRPRHVISQLIKFAYDKFVLGADLHSGKYPFARSYSDIFIVPGSHVETFVRYCGVFAATDLWVELAIPTALVLTGAKIRVQSEMQLRGRPLWTTDDYEVLKPFGNNLQNLLRSFPDGYIYLHPIKLSKWDVALDAEVLTEAEPAAMTGSEGKL